jgi:pimeloyl-ACP methyl ester carboxylesterase
MPYVQSNGIRIHYEVEGQGPPLVMIHGWSWSIGDFYEYGWVKGLQDDNQLILIDPRGHGYSDKPHEVAAYDQQLMVQDVLNVMDALHIRRAAYMGASMGGMIGFGLAEAAPERLYAVLPGAATPYFSELSLAEAKSSEMWSRLSRDMRAYLEWDIPLSASLEVTDWFLCRQLANDPQALLACLEALYGFKNHEFLPHNTVPCLLFVGTADGNYPDVKRCAGEMRNAQLLEVPNRGHGELFRVVEALPGIKQFLASVQEG